MTNQLITPARALDRNGEPQAGAKAYVYITGTTTQVTVTGAAGVALPSPSPPIWTGFSRRCSTRAAVNCGLC